MDNVTVSLKQVYDQVQEMMDSAGIGTRTLWVEGKLVGYEHIKTGKHGKSSQEPTTEMRIYISGEGDPAINCSHWSASVVLETIKVEIEKLKITKNPTDQIQDIQL